MPRATDYVQTNLILAFAGGTEVRRRTKVNPFQAATATPDGTPSMTLPPAPPVGLVYPR